MTKKHIVVASTNPVKLDCTHLAFAQIFPKDNLQFSTISVPSGVPDQPMGQLQTRTGAINRANNARKAVSEADFWVGLEGGLELVPVLDTNSQPTGKQELHTLVYICVLDKSGKKGEGHAAGFQIPPEIAHLVLEQNMELGHADDLVFKRQNSKQQDGACGILTRGIITRSNLYQMAVTFALVPFINSNLYD